MSSLYIFLDESGNFDFSPSGTEYFVVCSYTIEDPSSSILEVYKLKYSLLNVGYEQECFHATSDKQAVRDRFYSIIATSKGIYDFIYVKKKDLAPHMRNKKDMYTLLVQTILHFILNTESTLGKIHDQVIVILDKVLTYVEKNHTQQVIKATLKKFNIRFFIYFFQTKSDCNAQIADYGSWARYISLTRKEERPMAVIKHLSRLDINILNTHI